MNNDDFERKMCRIVALLLTLGTGVAIAVTLLWPFLRP